MPTSTTSGTTPTASVVASAAVVRGQQLQAGIGHHRGTQPALSPSSHRRAHGLLGSASPLLVFAHSAAHGAHSHSGRAHRALVHQPQSESRSQQQMGAQASGISEFSHSESRLQLRRQPQALVVGTGRVGTSAIARVFAHSRNPEAADSAGSSGGRSGTTKSSTRARSRTRELVSSAPSSRVSRASLGETAPAAAFGARLGGHLLRRGMSTAGTSDSVRALMESSWHSSHARSSQSGSRSRSGDAEWDAEGDGVDAEQMEQAAYMGREREMATSRQRQRTREARLEEERSRTSQRASADCSKYTSQKRTHSHRYSRLPRSLSSETHSRRSK